MADQKISQLTALTTADQADVYPIVDTSASETKKITQQDVEDTIANSTNFVDQLVANNYFTDELANSSNFVNELTQNSSFQSAVNNFVTNVGVTGSGTGGKPITFALPDVVGQTSNPLSGYTDSEALVYSNGSTVYLQDAVGYTQSRDVVNDWASATSIQSFVLLGAYAYFLLSSGAALQIYRYNRNDLSAGGTLMTVSGATLTYGANVVITSNGAEFFINYDAGQSANSYSIAKFTLSGTTLTYVSATNAGSTANQFTGRFAVDSFTNYYGTNNGILYQYDNTGTLQVTSGATLSVITRIVNWADTLYGADSSGQFFNKIYIQDTDLTGGATGTIIPLTAAEDIAIGDLLGISNLVDDNAAMGVYISRPVTGATATISAGNNVSTSAQIGTNKTVELYNDNAGKLLVSVLTIDPDTLSATRGAEATVITGYTVSSTSPRLSSVFALDTDKFIVFYNSTTSIVYKIGTVSGSTITLQAQQTANTLGNNITNIAGCQVDTDKGFVAYNTSADKKAIAFTVSGTTATFGSSVNYDSNVGDTTIISRKIGTDKVVLSGFDTNCYSQVFTLSGTALTGGTAVQFSAAGAFTPERASVTSPATDVFVNSYENKMIAATVSGTTITFGTEITVGVVDSVSTVAKSATKIWTINSSTLYEVTISGNTLTLSSNIINSCIDSEDMQSNLINIGSYVMFSRTVANTIFIEGMSNNFLGIAQNAASKGNTVLVLIRGMDDNQSNLVTGAYYTVSNGALSILSTGSTVDNPNEVVLLRAISSSKLLV